VAFSGVVREVEQLEPAILEVLDEFFLAGRRPVAGDQCRRRPAALIRIVRIVPDEVARRKPPRAVEDRPQTAAVEDVAGRQLCAGGIEERGGDIERGDRHVAGRPGRHHSGPADHERHPDAPLVDKPLPGPQRQVRGGAALGRGQAAVVTGEDDQRVIRLARPLDRREHGGHRLIHLPDHAGVDRVILDALGEGIARRGRRDVEPRPHAHGPAALLGRQVGPRDQGHVDRVHRHVAEPGPAGGGSLRDERRRLAGDRPSMHRVIERP